MMSYKYTRTEEQYPQPRVRFNVSKMVEVQPWVEVRTLAAISAVWRTFVDRPTSVNVMFADTLPLDLPDGNSMSIGSLYNKDTDTISIAPRTLQELHPELSLEAAAVLYAGHVTRHRIQTYIGDEPPTFGCTTVGGRHEDEAWRSAILAHASVFPGEWATFTVGEQTYSSKLGQE